MRRGIRLRGVSAPIKGKVWHSETLLRSGRLATLEIVLDDSSVSRKHAEVRLASDGQSWTVVDLNSTNGTYVNGTRVTIDVEPVLKQRDIVQFGKVAFSVEMSENSLEGPPSDQLILAASLSPIPASQLNSRITNFRDLRGNNPSLLADDRLMALMQAGHHLVHLQSEDQLLDSILNDMVSVLDAQRGAIVLAEGDGPEPKLRLRSLSVGPREPSSRFPFSKRLTQQAYAAGQSMLFKNLEDSDEMRNNHSIADGAMGSVLCVMLRTPRRKLGVLHLDRRILAPPFTEADLKLADAMAAHVSAGIECSLLLRAQRDLFLKTITTLADMVELRDKYTGGHTRRVTAYATMLAEKMDLPEDQMERIRIGTPLHDIGKIGISDAILQKPGRLTAKEFAEMQTHTTLGAQYLGGISELAPIIPIVRNHHERWDGTGYPDRLAGEQIPLLARIVAVCDAFDAITSDRPYHENQKGKPPEYGFAEIARQKGRQFDPQCATAFLEIRDDILRVMCEMIPGLSSRINADAGPATFVGNGPSVDATPPPHHPGDSMSEINVMN